MSCEPAILPIKIKRSITYGPLTVTCQDVNFVAVDLTGYSVFANARPELESSTVIDLVPVITDPINGIITIALTDTQTDGFAAGQYVWDLVLENQDSERLGPFLTGPLEVIDIVSRD